jgi:hypothetical protein
MYMYDRKLVNENRTTSVGSSEAEAHLTCSCLRQQRNLTSTGDQQLWRLAEPLAQHRMKALLGISHLHWCDQQTLTSTPSWAHRVLVEPFCQVTCVPAVATTRAHGE